MRWIIETTCQQLKAFRDFTEYRVRRRTHIARLVNMQAALHSVRSLPPALDECCSELAQMRLQERRWHIGHLLSREIFFCEFRQRSQTHHHFRLFRELYQVFVLRESCGLKRENKARANTVLM